MVSMQGKELYFFYFKTSHEFIRLAVMLYIQIPLSLRNVEDLVHERSVDGTYNLNHGDNPCDHYSHLCQICDYPR